MFILTVKQVNIGYGVHASLVCIFLSWSKHMKALQVKMYGKHTKISVVFRLYWFGLVSCRVSLSQDKLQFFSVSLHRQDRVDMYVTNTTAPVLSSGSTIKCRSFIFFQRTVNFSQLSKPTTYLSTIIGHVKRQTKKKYTAKLAQTCLCVVLAPWLASQQILRIMINCTFLPRFLKIQFKILYW